MTETVTTAAHWGVYEAERDAGGNAVIRPLRGDPRPAVISDDLRDVASPRARIATPLVREGYLADGPASREGRGRERYVPVSWDRALELAARALQDTRDRLGAEGVYAGSYGWASAGRFHHAQSQMKRFMNLTGGFVRGVNTYSSAAAEVITPHFFGSGDMINTGHDWTVIARHTELLVAFGGLPFKNAQIDAGSTGPHLDHQGFAACMDKGLQVVTVGPIRHEVEKRPGVDWLRPRPNTDVALMLGLAHVLLADGTIDRDFLDRCCTGTDRLIAYIDGREDGVPKTPAWAAAITGLEAETIAALARRMAAKRTLISVTWALQRADHGEQTFWMAAALAALLGGLGRPGQGVAFGAGTFNNYNAGRLPFRWAAFPQGQAPCDRYIPVARVADMLLRPGTTIPYDGRRVTFPEIGMVWWSGGNPYHHHQDLHRLTGALRRPDTVVVIDSLFQPTCRMADIVLPATTFLERNDWAGSAHGGYATPMHKLREPFAEARNDHDIFAALADRFGIREAFTEGRDEMGWIRHMWGTSRDNARRAGIELPSFEDFWTGGLLDLESTNVSALRLARLRDDPAAHPLRTPSGKVELYSETIAGFGYADCPGHPAWMEPKEWLGAPEAARLPLHLMSDQPKGRLHSQLDPGEASARTKVRGREPVLMNPADARRRGIADGDIVRLANGRGACLGGAVLTEDVMEGVVVMSTGSWFDAEDPGNAASLERHGNPNVLTRDEGTSSLAQGPSCNSCLVEATKFTGNLPAVEAYDLPLAG